MIKFFQNRDDVAGFEEPSPLSEFFTEPKYSIQKQPNQQSLQHIHQQEAVGGCLNIFCNKPCQSNEQMRLQPPTIVGRLTSLNGAKGSGRTINTPNPQEISLLFVKMLAGL